MKLKWNDPRALIVPGLTALNFYGGVLVGQKHGLLGALLSLPTSMVLGAIAGHWLFLKDHR